MRVTQGVEDRNGRTGMGMGGRGWEWEGGDRNGREGMEMGGWGWEWEGGDWNGKAGMGIAGWVWLHCIMVDIRGRVGEENGRMIRVEYIWKGLFTSGKGIII